MWKWPLVRRAYGWLPVKLFFVRSFVRPFVLAFDRNGGARFGGARGRAGPHRFDQMQNESIFFDFWRRAAHRRQKSKKMRNENFWSRAQIKVQVMTRISVQFLSKSELSSGIFDHVKVCEKVSVRVPLSKMPSWIQNRNRHMGLGIWENRSFVRTDGLTDGKKNPKKLRNGAALISRKPVQGKGEKNWWGRLGSSQVWRLFNEKLTKNSTKISMKKN